jgi:2-phosphosulfolactate phosphatase
VVPFPWADEDAAAAEAERRGGVAATRRAPFGDTSVPSLSPVSLRLLERGTVLVLPSPNGSSLATAAASAGVTVISGCLRNAGAIAQAVDQFPVGMVAAGERWPDGSLRPCFEDGLGAGVIARLLGYAGRSLSPEAMGMPFEGPMVECASARELTEVGWGLDVEVAAAVDVSRTVPILRADGAFAAA